MLPTPLLDISLLGRPRAASRASSASRSTRSFKTNRKFYVNYTNRERRHRDPRVPDVDREPRPGRGGLGADDPADRPAVREPQRRDARLRARRATCTSAWATAGAAATPATAPRTCTTLLGKMLRIDVNGTTSTQRLPHPLVEPVRRPDRAATRSGSGACATRGGSRSTARTATCGSATSGRRAYEEVDRASDGASGPGRGTNWGWRVMEGHHCHIRRPAATRAASGCRSLEYSHASQRPLRGHRRLRLPRHAIPALHGCYVFGDYCSGEILARGSATGRPRTRSDASGRDTAAVSISTVRRERACGDCSRVDGSRVRAIAWDGRVPDSDIRAAATWPTRRHGAEADAGRLASAGTASATAVDDAFFLLDPNSWR